MPRLLLILSKLEECCAENTHIEGRKLCVVTVGEGDVGTRRPRRVEFSAVDENGRAGAR